MRLDWDHWLYSLGKAVIGGMAAAGAAWCGTAIGHAISPQDVPVMNWSSLGFVILTSSITNLFFFLKQSPLPKDLDEKQND
jgi:hypothetical protein